MKSIHDRNVGRKDSLAEKALNTEDDFIPSATCAWEQDGAWTRVDFQLAWMGDHSFSHDS